MVYNALTTSILSLMLLGNAALAQDPEPLAPSGHILCMIMDESKGALIGRVGQAFVLSDPRTHIPLRVIDLRDSSTKLLFSAYRSKESGRAKIELGEVRSKYRASAELADGADQTYLSFAGENFAIYTICKFKP